MDNCSVNLTVVGGKEGVKKNKLIIKMANNKKKRVFHASRLELVPL